MTQQAADRRMKNERRLDSQLNKDFSVRLVKMGLNKPETTAGGGVRRYGLIDVYPVNPYTINTLKAPNSD